MLEHPPWWFSIVPPATAPLHHAGSTNLCIHLSPSISFPKLINGPRSTKDAVSYRTRPIFASPLLSPLNSADLPFLRIICKAVLTIWSQFTAYKFNVILASQGTWGEFTGTQGFGRRNIEEKSAERLGYRECSALNPCGSTATLLSLP